MYRNGAVVFCGAAIVALNRDMFFEKRHVGNIIPADKQP